ncbi:MAG TPA: hypothetical protein VFR24_27670 [Candidatus Angelobacter sp.]|nr:hypothetical protein [Candidatus Angelobacter sp.]
MTKKIKRKNTDTPELTQIKLHYERISKAKNFAEFKVAQLTFIHQLIQEREQRIPSRGILARMEWRVMSREATQTD